MKTKNIKRYSNKKLKIFLWEWENLLPTRKIININTYIAARKEAFRRWNDNSYYYIQFFSNNPEASIDDFQMWFKEI